MSVYLEIYVEYSIGNGQLFDVTCSAHEMGRLHELPITDGILYLLLTG